MRHELHTDVVIDAPPAIVWEVLTDLDQYSTWNPFIVSAAGDVAVGQRLINRLQPPGGKPMTFRPRVTAADPGQSLEWLGRLGIPGVFDGRHRFELSPTADGGTRLVQSEQFSGLLVRFLRTSLDTRTRRGFEDMNTALAKQSTRIAARN